MVVAGRLDGDDVAVMMVEAGGTANTWELYENGTPKVDEDTLAGGLEACKTWIREMIELQQERASTQLGPIEKMEAPLSIDYTDEIYAAVEAAGTDRIAETQKIADKTDRQNAESEVNAPLVAELEGQFAENRRCRQADQGRRSFGHEEGRAQAHRRRGHPHRRPQGCRPAHRQLQTAL